MRLCDHDGEGSSSSVAADERVREKYRNETKLEETHQDLQCGVKYDKEHSLILRLPDLFNISACCE